MSRQQILKSGTLSRESTGLRIPWQPQIYLERRRDIRITQIFAVPETNMILWRAFYFASHHRGMVCFRGGMVQTNEQYEFVHQVLCLYERELPLRPPSCE